MIVWRRDNGNILEEDTLKEVQRINEYLFEEIKVKNNLSKRFASEPTVLSVSAAIQNPQFFTYYDLCLSLNGKCFQNNHVDFVYKW